MSVTYPSLVYNAQLKRIGQAIRERREAPGFTKEGFAHHAQIARTFCGRIEGGEQNLALKTLFLLAGHLKVAPAELTKDVTLDECRAVANGSEDAASQ